METRFWNYVDKNGPIHKTLRTRCWMWTAGKIKGYGYFWGNGKTLKAHRVSYQMNVRRIPEGLCVLHRCDNRACVNPEHLFLGTSLDNRIDCVKKGRQARGVTHMSFLKPETQARGERIGSSVLTDELVRYVRKIYKPKHKKFGARALARSIGVDHLTIERAIRRETWNHVK